LLLDASLDFFVGHLAFVLGELFGKCPDDSPALFAARHREEGNHCITRKATVKCIVSVLPIDFDVGDVEDTFKGTAFKRKSECITYRTPGAVATNQVFG